MNDFEFDFEQEAKQLLDSLVTAEGTEPFVAYTSRTKVTTRKGNATISDYVVNARLYGDNCAELRLGSEEELPELSAKIITTSSLSDKYKSLSYNSKKNFEMLVVSHLKVVLNWTKKPHHPPIQVKMLTMQNKLQVSITFYKHLDHETQLFYHERILTAITAAKSRIQL